jgi:tetratricopeptide (TPR) repeat protein
VRSRIHSSGGRVALALLCLSLLAPYAWWIERVYRASHLADSNRLEDLERAARLVPENAEFPHAAGLQLSESFQSYESAMRYLQTAATLNPNSANNWLDLASIDLAAGKLPEQDAALEQALQAEPGNPDVAAEVADYYLAAGEASRALPLFRRAMAEDPSSAESLLGVSWNATRDAKLMLDQVVPPNPEIQLDFLRLLTDRGDSTSAHLVWEHLLAGRANFRPQLSFFYFDYMIRMHESENYARACTQLPDDLPSLKNYSPNENLIVNPGFELPLLYGGCDWRYERVDHAAAGIDDQVAHSGSRSLSATFDGSPVEDLGWKECVPLQPNKDYEFSAWIKSEDVVSSSGPRFSIADAYTGATILLTDDILDTHSWQEIHGSFRAPADTQLATIRIIRSPGNTMIRGRVWIDDLRLVPR